MRLAEELSMKIPRFNRSAARVVLGLDMKDDRRRVVARVPFVPNRKAKPAVMSVMSDGRARELGQVAAEAKVAPVTVRKILGPLKDRGEVELTIIAGHWLYSITQFRG